MKDIELVTILSKQTDLSPREIIGILSTLYKLMGDTIAKGGSININGLGQFEAKKKSERFSTNPANGKRYLVPPKLTPVFKPASHWKSYLKKLDNNE
jgi:DNA-binding protein HU-beta